MGSALLTPGGQKEMLYSASWLNTLTLDSSHKGFIKVAMQCAAREPSRRYYVVPLLSFGETMVCMLEDGVAINPILLLSSSFKTLDNVQAPYLQRALTKIFHANVLFLPYGALNLPGVPRKHRLVVVAGHRIEIPAVGNPTREQVGRCRVWVVAKVNRRFPS